MQCQSINMLSENVLNMSNIVCKTNKYRFLLYLRSIDNLFCFL